VRLSVKIFPGVRISSSTRRRRPKRRTPAAQVWTHTGCSTRHRTEAAAQKCANAVAAKQAKAASAAAPRTTAARTTTAPLVNQAQTAKDSRLAQMAARASGNRPAPGPEFFHPFGETSAAEPARPAATPANPSDAPPPPRFPEPSSAEKPAVVVPPPNREKGWSHLYLATELARGIAEYETEYEAHLLRLISPSTEVVTHVAEDLKRRLDQLSESVHRTNSYLAPELVKKGFGSAVAEGDDVTLRVIAAGITGVYVSIMRWAASVRGTQVPALWRLYQAHADLADAPVEEIRQFSIDFSQQAGEAVAALRAGLPPKPVHVTLRMTIGEEDMSNLNAAFEAAKAARR
jgi:hypothetical protein